MNANGCHCESDDDFKKCFAASCAGECPGTGEPVVLDWRDVPSFTEVARRLR